METFIRRSLGLKAHTVVKVEEREVEGERELLIYVERLGQRRLRCGVCGLQAQRVVPRPRAPAPLSAPDTLPAPLATRYRAAHRPRGPA
jgi:hypothetical protein